jgi:hypothetical protein
VSENPVGRFIDKTRNVHKFFMILAILVLSMQFFIVFYFYGIISAFISMVIGE